MTCPDALVAATAERAERQGLVVIHYDAAYDRITSVTDQRYEWVVPQGSVS